MSSAASSGSSSESPLVGIGFRVPIAKWTLANLHRFDVLEVTVDHYIKGGEYVRRAIRNLVDRVPLVLHGVGLSIGTDTPLDDAYLDAVAEAVEDLKVPSYSEHLAWTKVPGIDLANLLPVPRTRAAADMLIPKIERVRTHLPVPFSIENISYVFDFPDAEMSDAEFFNLLFRETGVEMLLDVENLFVNASNHAVDPLAFLDQLPRGVVTGMHVAGGPLIRRPYLDAPFHADNHSHPVPQQALDLLEYALDRQRPRTVILERDNDYEQGEELLADVTRIRRRGALPPPQRKRGEAMHRLIDRQTRLLRHLTSPSLIFGTRELDSAARDPGLQGMDMGRLRLEAEFSYHKRMGRIRKTFERTATLLGNRFPALLRDYAAACPPLTYERYPDAARFHERFLTPGAQERWRPPWAADVAAIELALARAQTLRPTAVESEALATQPRTPGVWYRAHPCACLVRCRHDVRALFEAARSRAPVTERPVPVVVLASRGRRRPRVLELTPEAFALLEITREWTPLAPAADRTGGNPVHGAATPADGGAGGAARDPVSAGDDGETRREMVRQLAAQGLVLVSVDDTRDPAQA